MADRYEAGAPMLEPMGVGEILDAGFRLWRRNFGSLAAIVATVLGPVALLTLLFQWSQIVAVIPWPVRRTSSPVCG